MNAIGPKERLWHLASLPFKAYIVLAPFALFLVTGVGMLTGGLITGTNNHAIASEYARIMLRVEYGYIPCIAAVMIDAWQAARRQDKKGVLFGVIFLMLGLFFLGFFHLMADLPKTH